MSDLTAMEKALTAWGEPLHDWVFALTQEIDATSQGNVAKRIEFSPATVSQIVRKTYPSSYSPVEAKVREKLMSADVQCPYQGDAISMETCFRNQDHAKKGAGQSAVRIMMARACQNCEMWRG